MSDTLDQAEHHWDFVDEDGCLHCNCGIGVIEPQSGSKPFARHWFVRDFNRPLTCDACNGPEESPRHVRTVVELFDAHRQLLAEVERLTEQRDQWTEDAINQAGENARLWAEVERLRAALANYRERHPCTHAVKCWADSDALALGHHKE
jgi:hypothetical protein